MNNRDFNDEVPDIVNKYLIFFLFLFKSDEDYNYYNLALISREKKSFST